MILAIDFDGTIVKHAFPAIGPLRQNAASAIKKLHDDGHKIIIWTCRYTEEHLKPMRELLKSAGIPYDAINSNINPGQFNPVPKVYADIYIDDRQLGGIPSDWNDIYKLVQNHVYQHIMSARGNGK